MLFIVITDTARAQNLSTEAVQDISIEQHLDTQVDLGLTFFDEQGNPVTLGNYFGKKPIILTFVYYECPMLCTQVLNGMTRALNTLKFDIGDQFEVVTVSIDPGETPELARSKKAAYAKEYNRPGVENGWHFLTGDSASINTLATSAGFKFVYDPEEDQYAHASGIMVLTPSGKISKYFLGIEYAPKDIQFGLMEASDEVIGSPVDQLILLCYHYDPTTGKYGFVVTGLIKIVGTATLFGLVGFVLVSLRRERKKNKEEANAIPQ